MNVHIGFSKTGYLGAPVAIHDPLGNVTDVIDTEGSDHVEAVKVHDPGPSRDEVPGELLLRVLASLDLGNGSEFRVRTEEEQEI